MKNIHISKLVTFSVASTLLFCGLTSTTFGADVCTFDPDIDCPVSVTLNPSTYTVPSGGNTNVSATVNGIFQWGAVEVLNFNFSLPSGSMGPNGGTVTGNTGSLTSGVNVSAFVQNTEGVVDTDSVYISVTAAPTVNIYFSFLEKVRQFFTSNRGTDSIAFAK
jgi:hypothetical protein